VVFQSHPSAYVPCHGKLIYLYVESLLCFANSLFCPTSLLPLVPSDKHPPLSLLSPC
jgi:hypothetical protein